MPAWEIRTIKNNLFLFVTESPLIAEIWWSMGFVVRELVLVPR